MKLDMVIWISLILGCLSLLSGGLFGHFKEGLSLFAGAAWGSVNLFFLKALISQLLLKKNYGQIFLLLSIKWPLLYLAGYALLKSNKLSPFYLLIGFSYIFAMLVITGLIQVVRSAK